MVKIYNIGSSQDAKINECRPFDIQGQEIVGEFSSTAYSEILKIFREAFALIDITQVIKKL